VKITKAKLKQIIREENQRILKEMGGDHGAMYGNPGDMRDPNQWDEEVPFCPYSHIDSMEGASVEQIFSGLSDSEAEAVQEVLADREIEQMRHEQQGPEISENATKTMKITKRQLKRIIREEKAKIIKEVSDDGHEWNHADFMKNQAYGKALSDMDGLILWVTEETERHNDSELRYQIFNKMIEKLQKATQ
jgi:hypothetical protein